MRTLARKLLVAALLMLCVGIHALEVSGHWDRTFDDANDEAGIVAVVLCVGVAISIAGTILERPVARAICRVIPLPRSARLRLEDLRSGLPVYLCSPPPLPLRI